MLRLALFGLLLALPRSSFATVVVPRTVDQMTAEAKTVVLGLVLSRESRWDDARRRIHTFTEVRVTETWAGEAPGRLVIRTLGGEVGSIGMKVSGMPQFQVGEEVVLFLAADAMDAERFQVMGLAQGKFHVDRSRGAAQAVPSTEGLVFAVRDGTGNLSVDPSATGLRAVALDALRTRVKTARSAPAVLTPAPSPVTPAPVTPMTPPAAPVTPKLPPPAVPDEPGR